MVSVLQASGITTRLGNKLVLSNLNLPELNTGEVSALMGPNGCGKSTLLKSLAGLVNCQARTLTYDGKPLAQSTPNEPSPLVGYLPQNLPEGPNLTVLEALLVALTNTAQSVSKQTRLRHAELILEQLGILALAQARADRLSGGQKQLLALGQLLCRNPRILLLDEPFSALDMAHTYAVMTLLKTITQQRQLITIFVTHDLNFALHNANFVLLMHNGQLNHAGPPASVLSPSRIAEIFGVMARVEYCSRGNPFIFVDGPAKNRL